MEIASSLITFLSVQPFLVAAIVTVLCLLLALLAVRSVRFPYLEAPKSDGVDSVASAKKVCNCVCSCNGGFGAPDSEATVTPYVNGGTASMVEKASSVSVAVAERLTGASMMEQLVPEITTHALSYLDFPSLCRLSMTNSLMRKAANDDNAWKALYHKDFTLEQDSVTPANGWKAYYAATRAIVTINADFFSIIKERSLPAMSHFWLNADYVKCVHPSGELFSGLPISS